MLDGLLWIAKMFESYDGCYCMTFARGLDKPEMLRRFGADPSQAVLLPFQDAQRLWETFGTSVDSDSRRVTLETISPFVQVGSCDGWAFAIESVSAEGIRPEVLRAVSVGTVVVSVCYVGAKALAIFSYAEDRVLVAQFDPLVDLPYGDDPSGVLPDGDDPMRLLPVIRQVDIEREDYVETMFELAEKIGVHLPREVVAETLLLSAGVVPLLPPSLE